MRQRRGPEPDPPGVEVYEFVVPGRPASVHEKDPAVREAWIDRLIISAMKAAPPLPPFLDSAARVTIVFLIDRERRRDVDNVIKPILDAMVLAYYADDEVVSDVQAHRRTWRDKVDVDRFPQLLREAWLERVECTYVRIENAPRLEELL